MKNKLVKTLMISFMLVFSMMFINVNETKAMGKPNGKGFAECEYKVAKETGASDTQQRLFAIRITVFKNTDGNYDGYAITGCGNVESTNKNSASYYDENRCKISNYSEMFNRKDLKKYFASSSVTNNVGDDPLDKKSDKWKCPTLYAKIGNTRTDVNTTIELSYKKQTGKDWKKITQKSNFSSKTGNPTLKAGIYSGNKTDGVANSIEKEKNNNGHSTNSNGLDTTGGVGHTAGCTMLKKDGEFLKMLQLAFTIMQVAGVVLLVVLSIVDFMRGIASDEQDRIKKLSKKFIFRLIAAAILLLAPVIIALVLDILVLSGVEGIRDSCVDIFFS